MTTENLTDHFANCKQVNQVIADANALLDLARAELIVAREVLEVLQLYQHEKMLVDTKYRRWNLDKSSMTAIEVAQVAVRRLNKFIGDRA
jgi:hypothetical protein